MISNRIYLFQETHIGGEPNMSKSAVVKNKHLWQDISKHARDWIRYTGDRQAAGNELLFRLQTL